MAAVTVSAVPVPGLLDNIATLPAVRAHVGEGIVGAGVT